MGGRGKRGPRGSVGAREGPRGSRGSPRSDIHAALAALPPDARAAAMEVMRNGGKEKPKKITLRELVTMWDRLEMFMDLRADNAMFAHRVAANRATLKPEVTKAHEAAEPPDDYKAFDTAREELCKEFAEKAEDGEPMQEDERYKIPAEQQEEFDRRADELREKHAKAIADYQTQLDAYEKVLDQEVTCPTFVPIPTSLLPGGFTARFLEPLLLMLQ